MPPRGREPGGVLATGQGNIGLGQWPRPPPGSLPRGDTHTPIFGLRSRGRILRKMVWSWILGRCNIVWLIGSDQRGGLGNIELVIQNRKITREM